MTIHKNVSLKKYNTFGLDYIAESMIHLKTPQEARDFFRNGNSHLNPVLIIGGGSNLLFTSDFKGLIIHIEFDGIEIEEQYNDHVIVSAGAGVTWDKLVEWTVNKGFTGLENLSLIPGTVGASPVQNIGAYGVEVKDSVEKVEGIDILNGSSRSFSRSDCEFGYRTSVFKKAEKGRYLVNRVYFKLIIEPELNLSYGSLNDEVKKLGGATLPNVRQAVINIRTNKLPDPEHIGNAGSFFKNPAVNVTEAETLRNKYPQMPFYEDEQGLVKLAAGWLIDQCGWKGKRIGDAGVHDKQALVLVNYGKATGTEIYDLSESIKRSVQDKFGIELEREVEVVGAI